MALRRAKGELAGDPLGPPAAHAAVLRKDLTRARTLYDALQPYAACVTVSVARRAALTLAMSGFSEACAVRDDGAVVCWLPFTTGDPLPVPPEGLIVRTR